MKVEIIDYIEDSDNGGATVTLEIDEEGKTCLIERGFNSLLLDAIERMQRDSILTKLTQEAQKNGEYDVPEDIAEHNRKTIERLKQHEEWRKDDMSNYPSSPEEKKIKDHLKK